eukprot:augustus_masked-scaffold_7-processed-gene-1.60-mRNA-1 protein AED:1.00 eAED:1.00 QI:0/0/0/0/1/1/3/0/221
MSPCGIDSFLIAIKLGCIMMESESSTDFVKDLKVLGIDKAEVIMTDGSKALEAAIEAVGASHVLCRKHVLAALSSAVSDLEGNKKIKFTSNLQDALKGSFSEEKDPAQFVENALTTLEKFKDVIKKEKLFSEEVNEMLPVELKLMGVCWIVKKLSEREFVVSDSKFKVKKKYIVEVVERDWVEIPSYSEKQQQRQEESLCENPEDDRSLEGKLGWKFCKHG